MYKTLSQNLQRGWGRDLSCPVKEYVPRTRAEIRCWWYPIIAHHQTLTSIKAKYGKKLPVWLAQELWQFTPEKWLHYWSRTTGLPQKLLKPRKILEPLSRRNRA
jgi:hypothetical protein